METQKQYIARRKEEIIKDVLNIARLEMVGGFLGSDGIMHLVSHDTIKAEIDNLNYKVSQAAKMIIASSNP